MTPKAECEVLMKEVLAFAEQWRFRNTWGIARSRAPPCIPPWRRIASGSSGGS